MIDLTVTGKPLVLPPDLRVSIDHLNTLLTWDLDNSFSLPFEVPMRGNEDALQYVHLLPAARRTTTFRNTAFGQNGLHLHPGSLEVLATNDRVIRTNFHVQDLVGLLSGITLPDALEGAVVDLRYDELVNSYKFHGRPTRANGGNCQFPMHLNRELYGSENPNWNPNASAWSATSGYAVDDLVEFTSTDVVERVQVWQCTAITSPGESPATHPGKWRLTAFALVNAWDATGPEHYQNTTTAHFYAMVPWFYHKWILQQALASVGLRPAGEWWDDPDTDEELCPNATTLDRAFERDTDYFFQAQLTAPEAITSLDQDTWLLPANDDTTLPNVDASGLWDGEYFSPNAAGTWRFRVRVTMDRIAEDTTFMQLWVVEESGFTSRGIGAKALSPGQPREQVIEVVATFSAPDVGQNFRLHVFQKSIGQIITWGNNIGDTYAAATVTGWLENYTGVVTPDELVIASRHVPDMEVSSYLLALSDLYNLEIRPDLVNNTVHLDYRQSALQEKPTDQSHRATGPVEIDHQRSITGITLAHDLETFDDAGGILDTATLVDTESDLTAPPTIGLTTIVKNTRKVMRSVVSNGTLVWRHVGYHVPAHTVGDPTDAREVKPAIIPLHMEQVSLDGEDFLVPVFDHKGTSAWYDTRAEMSKAYVCSFLLHESESGSVPDLPSARSWGRGWSVTDTGGKNHLWDDADAPKGLLQLHWQDFATTLVDAEPITRDLIVDLPFLLGHQWRRLITIHDQLYLIERLPFPYGGNAQRTVAEGVYLYRIIR